MSSELDPWAVLDQAQAFLAWAEKQGGPTVVVVPGTSTMVTLFARWSRTKDFDPADERRIRAAIKAAVGKGRAA